jgi:phosphoribosylformylglycinamidine synthase PurS subunit
VPSFEAMVEVTLREGIADPEGAAMERSLPALGVPPTTAHAIRVGKAIRLTVEAADEAAARVILDDLCTRFFTNPVLQDATITLQATAPA